MTLGSLFVKAMTARYWRLRDTGATLLARGEMALMKDRVLGLWTIRRGRGIVRSQNGKRPNH
ncbi:hypothetical protein CBM2614_A250396 [Cupriavidus taiwanensis]|nr:hypothetical protein CBM2614_A250396 [Cupriavidus taiwanensis]